MELLFSFWYSPFPDYLIQPCFVRKSQNLLSSSALICSISYQLKHRSQFVLSLFLGRKILNSLSLAYGQMILKSGFFHADPHPGNIFICKNTEASSEIKLRMPGTFYFFDVVSSLTMFYINLAYSYAVSWFTRCFLLSLPLMLILLFPQVVLCRTAALSKFCLKFFVALPWEEAQLLKVDASVCRVLVRLCQPPLVWSIPRWTVSWNEV